MPDLPEYLNRPRLGREHDEIRSRTFTYSLDVAGLNNMYMRTHGGHLIVMSDVKSRDMSFLTAGHEFKFSMKVSDIERSTFRRTKFYLQTQMESTRLRSRSF